MDSDDTFHAIYGNGKIELETSLILACSGLTLAGFGATAGFFALFFFSDIPRVRNDIMVKIPIIGDRWRKEIPASDNRQEADVTSVHRFLPPRLLS
ncbi:hypothetical protein BOTNAR_0240g00230 [Botryotinia narcissicola]|uniref:Uncharacterized protein n=1 Tax=Botryotinia narcissicola TaxID=278944 RepID=A0A4Z1I2U3_9HELO|nr:hypothetical protein BOTNAR_0240g00230 [Botryotinia narcissicola]